MNSTFSMRIGIVALVLVSASLLSPMLTPAFRQAFHDFQDTGMFRPVFWLAGSVDASPLIAMSLALFTAGALLFTLTGYGIGSPIAVLMVLLWLWHPLHVGIWQKLSPAECIALPFAILSLEFARRAAKSHPHRLWDVAWIACTLIALMSRNAFIGVVPAVLLARLGPDEWNHRGGHVFQTYRAIILSGVMLLLGGVGLSSSLGTDAMPELALVGLGLYLILAALLSALAETPRFRVRQAGWVGVAALLIFALSAQQ